jgi:hypothetical protein
MDFFCKIEKIEIKSNISEGNKNIFYKDKYYPKDKDEFIIHRNLINKLENLVKHGISNLFIRGQHDTGKYTLARFLLEKYYKNPCVLRECIFSNDGKDLVYFKSAHHYELYVDEHNCNIINLIKLFFKKIIQPITKYSLKNIILIKNVNLLKPEIINLLKYYLDKYYNNIFIIIGSSPILNINSFFLNIIVPKPNDIDMTKLIKKIIKNESLKVKKKELSYIIEKGNRKILKTISLLENCYISGEFEEHFDYNEKNISYIFKIVKNPSIDGMIKIREYLNQLLVNNMNMKEIIILFQTKILKDKKITQENKMKCIDLLKDCDYNFIKGYRELHHLEYFLIRIINLLKNTWDKNKNI